MEISIFHHFMKDGVSLIDRLNLDTPKLELRASDFHIDPHLQRPFLAALLVMVAALPFVGFIDERPEIVPERQSFDQFPLTHNGWTGRQLTLDGATLDTLKLTDYKQVDFSDADNTRINFYVAWYAAQKYGIGIHSPRACIPGGGWEIVSLEEHTIPGMQHVSGTPLVVNRALIQKNGNSQVVYYWFEGRNRDITNEYWAKWYLFWDALTLSRTDGALVRLIIHAPNPEDLSAADQNLVRFLKDFYPLLPAYTP
jgi:EpsI family protein